MGESKQDLQFGELCDGIFSIRSILFTRFRPRIAGMLDHEDISVENDTGHAVTGQDGYHLLDRKDWGSRCSRSCSRMRRIAIGE